MINYFPQGSKQDPVWIFFKQTNPSPYQQQPAHTQHTHNTHTQHTHTQLVISTLVVSTTDEGDSFWYVFKTKHK